MNINVLSEFIKNDGIHYAWKPCFVLGTGPSLNLIKDTNIFKYKGCVVAVNSAIELIGNCDIWLSCDDNVLKNGWAKNKKSKYKLLRLRTMEHCLLFTPEITNDIVWYNGIYLSYGNIPTEPNLLSTHASGVTALHLAVMMK